MLTLRHATALLVCLTACGSSDSKTEVDAAVTPAGDAAGDAAVAPTPQVPRYVYFSHAQGITIGAITSPATGAYTTVGELHGIGVAAGLRMAPDQKHLVAAGLGALDIFSIDPVSGWLEPVVNNSGTNVAVTNLDAVQFSPDGATLFVGVSTNNQLLAYHFDSTTGGLTQAGGAIALSDDAESLAVTPDGARVFAIGGYNLWAFSVANDGSLAQLPGFPVALDMNQGPPMSVRVDPTGKFLAYTLYGTDQIAVYAIDPATAALTAVPGSPYPVPGGPWSGEFSRDGHIFYIACETGSVVRSIALAPTTGAITDGPSTPFAATNGPRGIVFDREGKLAYVTQVNYIATTMMTVEPSGALVKTGVGRIKGGGALGAAILSGEQAVSIQPKFLYALDDTTNGSITAFAMDATTGALTLVSSVSVNQPDQAVVDPRGKYLYVISGASGLHTYAIGATGALTELGSPIAIGSSPHALEIARSGQHLYVAVGGNAQILTYTIGSNGVPMSSPLSTTTPSTTPTDVRLDGAGRQVFAATANSVATFIQQYAEQPAFGYGTSTGANSMPGLIAAAPEGKHMYVALSGTNQIAGFVQNDVSVAPLFVNGSPFAAGSAVHGVAVTPDGKYVYATDTGNYIGTATASVRAYSRDASTGALTPINGSFASLPRPYMATVDPTGKFLVVAATGTTSPTAAGGISMFAIQSDGTLGTATNTPLGSFVAWVTIVSSRE